MVTFSHSTVVLRVFVNLQSSVHSCTIDTADKIMSVFIAFMWCVVVRSGHSLSLTMGVFEASLMFFMRCT